MKKLDWFSRLENFVYWLLAYFVIFGAPLLAIYIVDYLFLKEISPFIRYPVWVIIGLVGILFGIYSMTSIEELFKSVRKKFGMKPLLELEEDIRSERTVTELAAEERRERWFTTHTESKQRYNIFVLQQQQLERLNSIHASIQIIIFIIIAIAVFYFLSRIFSRSWSF